MIHVSKAPLTSGQCLELAEHSNSVRVVSGRVYNRDLSQTLVLWRPALLQHIL